MIQRRFDLVHRGRRHAALTRSQILSRLRVGRDRVSEDRSSNPVVITLKDSFSLKHLRLTDSHPWVFSLMSQTRDPKLATRYCFDALTAYYQSHTPKTLCDLYGIPDLPPALHSIPLASDFFPWDDIDSTPNRADASEVQGNSEFLNSRSSNSWPGIGPLKSKVVWDTARRLVDVYSSIRDHGFRTRNNFDGLPVAVSLRNASGEDRWIIVSGTHRTAAAAALGIQEVPAQVVQVVQREQSIHWPGVRCGIYSQQQGEKVFDFFFAPDT